MREGLVFKTSWISVVFSWDFGISPGSGRIFVFLQVQMGFLYSSSSDEILVFLLVQMGFWFFSGFRWDFGISPDSDDIFYIYPGSDGDFGISLGSDEILVFLQVQMRFWFAPGSNEFLQFSGFAWNFERRTFSNSKSLA